MEPEDEQPVVAELQPSEGLFTSWKRPAIYPAIFATPEDDAESVPLDHTLPDFLTKITGTSDLSQVKKLRLRLPPRQSSLTRVTTCLPALRSLTLDGSSLGSLRHLGLGLILLRELSVVQCGLTSLDGLFGLPLLRRLWAGFNQIQDVESLAALKKLRSADLRANRVNDVEYVGFLNTCCPHLTEIVLAENPCAEDPDYRVRVRALLPRLVLLDGTSLPEFTGEQSSDEKELMIEDNEEEDDDDDFDDSSKSQSDISTGPAKAEHLWSPSDQPSASSEPFVASRSHKPATFRSYEDGPLSPAPQISKDLFYSRQTQSQIEGPTTSLTSGGIVCGNFSAALRYRTKRTRSQDIPSNSGDFAKSRAEKKPIDTAGFTRQEKSETKSVTDKHLQAGEETKVLNRKRSANASRRPSRVPLAHKGHIYST